MIQIQVKVNTRTLEHARKVLASMRNVPPAPPVAAMFDRWAKRYEVFIRRRYNAYSRGGGDWAPLKARTVSRRPAPARGGGGRGGSRVVVAGRKTTILKDTGQLFNALSIGKAGNVKEFIAGGVRFGIGGPARHHGKRRTLVYAGRGGRKGKVRGLVSSGITIGRLAAIHNAGAPKRGLPRRQIIVPPDANTIRQMENDARVMIRQILSGAGGGA